MEEELISFETAKLAKEKGFELNSICYYQLYSEGQLRYKLFTEGDENGGYVNEDSLNRIAVVTQTLLQKWLREVHNIIVTSKPYQDDVSNETDEDIEFQTLWENEILDVKDSYNIFSDHTFYHSYEEALGIGLYQALKLIK